MVRSQEAEDCPKYSTHALGRYIHEHPVSNWKFITLHVSILHIYTQVPSHIGVLYSEGK